MKKAAKKKALKLKTETLETLHVSEAKLDLAKGMACATTCGPPWQDLD